MVRLRRYLWPKEHKNPNRLSVACIESAAAFWSDMIQHAAADYLAGQYLELDFTNLRGTMNFEDEPSSFVAAILETRETGT